MRNKYQKWEYCNKKICFYRGVKGATCQTYMHELERFLARYDCQTIEDHFKISSETKNLSDEAGNTIENKFWVYNTHNNNFRR